MTRIGELLILLKELKTLLFDEKEALLKNDGDRIAEIVEIKIELLEEVKKFKDIDASRDEKLLELVEEINSIQKTNLLLTQQAIGYQEMLIESIAKNAKNFSNTYSSKGGYDTNKNINFIDHSI